MSRSFVHLVVGLAATAALVLYAPIAFVVALFAIPVAIAAGMILDWGRPHLAALGDTVERWRISLFIDSPTGPDFSMHRGTGLDAPLTGTPQVTAFA
ncbi:hypothetical protein [Caulobacter soli]|uniref:hypothetical protein n=1 Tax=Caulobacter soli TaxID=2708539 RepID=UPI0013EBDDE9|nr:hypothetical protein [Caulobacter soli]